MSRSPELTPYDVADRFFGAPDEDEIDRRIEESAWNALESGEAVQHIAERQELYNDAISQLRERMPGIDSKEAIQEMQPIVAQVGELCGEQVALDPQVLAQVYEAIGGSEKFTVHPDEARWLDLVRPGVDSAFTR